MHLSSHVTVKLQQRLIYSIYTDAGHAVRAPTPWARPAILFLWPPWDNILVLNLLLLCSNRSGLNSHDVADVRKRKKSIFSISASAESDFPECFEDRTTLGVSLSRRWSYLWTPQSRQSHRSFPQRRRRQVSDKYGAQQFSCSAPYLQCLFYVFVHSLFWKSGFQLLVQFLLPPAVWIRAHLRPDVHE